MQPLIAKMTSAYSIPCQPFDITVMVLSVLGLLAMVVPLDLGQLGFGFVGALCYAAMQASRNVTRGTWKYSQKTGRSKVEEVDPVIRKPRMMKAHNQFRKKEENQFGRQFERQETRQPSLQPVSAPIFKADNFASQVDELVSQIAPSKEGDRHVQEIAFEVQRRLSKLIPEADVSGFASGDALRGTAFAVAVPEVDIILNASPEQCADALMYRSSRLLPHAAKLEPRTLQKSILRACIDELTSMPGFKFRRSAFKGLEPKVTVMAYIGGKATPIDFSVNTVTPLHYAALITECGQIDPRAKELILLVRRWAKDRGVSHSAKGHLSPHAWSLLVIYFLQVWDGEGAPVLPDISSFTRSWGMLNAQQSGPHSATRRSARKRDGYERISVAALFKEFVQFYSSGFDFRNEGVCIRVGKREPASMALPLTIVTLSDGSSAVAPSIEDPFSPKHNLSEAMTGVTLARFREELARANSLCSEDAPLSQLIEPWVPPDVNATEVDHDADESSTACIAGANQPRCVEQPRC